MIREKDRGGLLRLEKEGLLTKGGSNTVTAASWDDQRHHTSGRKKIIDNALRCGNEGNWMTGDLTRRLDPGLGLQRWWKQYRVKSTPGIERLSSNMKTMGSRDQGDCPAEDVALLVKLRIWQLHQPLLQ